MAVSSLLQALEAEADLDKDMVNEKPMTVSYCSANINNKVNILWELKPVEAARNKYGFIGTPKDRKRIPMRLMCVLDISHSMAEPFGETEGNSSKLEKVKTFATLLVNELLPDDFLGIVTFGTKAKIIHQLAKLDDHRREKALAAISDIEVGGVTNLSQGLLLAVDQFVLDYRMITSCPHFDDNVILFTDGMANEGMLETWDLVPEVQKHILRLKKAHGYPDDYGIRLTTLGTGGFLPEMIFELGQAFSSDAFHFLDETNNLEISLFRPIYLRFLALVTRVRVKVTVLNGVEFDKEDMLQEYTTIEDELKEDHTDSEDSDNDLDKSPTHKGKKTKKKKEKNNKGEKEKNNKTKNDKGGKVKNDKGGKNNVGKQKNNKTEPVEIEEISENIVKCYIHDIGRELQRHIPTVIKLPKKHQKLLKDKAVMKIELDCRDIQFNRHHIEEEIMYNDLPIDSTSNKECEVLMVAQHQNRLTAVKSLDKSAVAIRKLDRIGAREALASGTNNIQDHTENISNLLQSEEAFDRLTEYTQPIISNLENCENMVGDYNTRWDDGWARLKALSSCLSRETPTATGVYVEGAALFETRELQKKLNTLSSTLKKLYKSKGLGTETIEKYLDVVKELEVRWEASKDYIPDPEPVTVFNFKI